MADKHNDNIPAIANTILADVPKIKENLEFHKDCFEAIATGWNNASATGLHVNDLDATVVRNSVTSHVQAVSYSAEKTKTVTGLDADGIYRLTGRLALAAGALVYLRFNADTGNNYRYIYEYWIDGNSASANYNYQAGQSAILLGTTLYATINLIDILVSSVPGSTANVIASFKQSGFVSTPYITTCSGTGYYAGGEALTSLTILCSENITGTLHVERIV